MLTRLLLSLSLAASASASVCTTACDATYGTGIPITMCGTDLITHNTYFDALCNTHSCYKDDCMVMTYYPGPCGCPNNCFADLDQGVCGSDGTCSCSKGWTGQDCSLVDIDNPCSLHGELIAPESEDSAFPFPYCQCDNGFTGVDCSSPAFADGYLPWGNIFDGDPYTSKDAYGDDHPLWNTSLISTIRIDIDEDLFLGLLYPWNSLNQTYAPVTVHFDNGYVQETITNVGFKQKGSGCRKHQKHCWNLKFNEFVDGQKLLNIKKLGIKAGTNDDDVLAKYMMYVDMLRAVVAPTQRTSYTLLYVNDIFYGLNIMHEDIDEDFMDTRLKNDNGEGNLYKFNGDVYLQYLSSEQETYESDDNYEQAEGDGNWTDFIDFLYYLNATSDEEFEQTIEDHIDTEAVLRLMIVESFLMGTDGMTRNGRNYNTYHLQDDSRLERWTLFNYDFDMFLEFNIDSHAPYMGEKYLNIFTFFEREVGEEEYNPLTNRMLAIPKYNETYQQMYAEFLEAAFGSNSKMQPTVLHGERMQFVLPWMEKDQMWQLSNGLSSTEFILYCEYTVELLAERYYNISQQLS